MRLKVLTTIIVQQDTCTGCHKKFFYFGELFLGYRAGLGIIFNELYSRTIFS